MHRPFREYLLVVLLSAALPMATACQEDDPQVTPTPDSGSPDVDAGGDAGGQTDAGTDGGVDDGGVNDATTGDTVQPDVEPDSGSDADTDADTDGPSDVGTDTGETDVIEPVVCEALETDYSPGADDTWPECSPDSGEYVPFEATISTIARIEAYEDMAVLLWENPAIPTSEDFIQARTLYATDEGLGSRVARREDEHYPPVTNAEGVTLSCRDEGVPALDPDRCVGPAQMLPIINDAFVAGINGEQPLINAARLDAALLWFLYLSTYKETVTCTNVIKDCDSSWAYYAGGTQADEAPLGLARVIDFAEPEAHDRVVDGLLAMRCWRDLDSAIPATDLARRDLSLAQMDRAMLRGIAAIMIERIGLLDGSTGDARAAHWAWLQIMSKAIRFEADQRDPDAAASLETAFSASSPDGFDSEGIIALLETTFPCP